MATQNPGSTPKTTDAPKRNADGEGKGPKGPKANGTEQAQETQRAAQAEARRIERDAQEQAARTQGAAEAFAAQGLPFFALTTIRDLGVEPLGPFHPEVDALPEIQG